MQQWFGILKKNQACIQRKTNKINFEKEKEKKTIINKIVNKNAFN